jgi:hypothetical protein
VPSIFGPGQAFFKALSKVDCPDGSVVQTILRVRLQKSSQVVQPILLIQKLLWPGTGSGRMHFTAGVQWDLFIF